jgi:hypothetical protein
MNETDNPLLNALTREGVLINVSVRFWRAAKKLQAADIGLDPDDVTDRLISLGHKKLLPREALAAFALIESRAHALVESNTFPFLNGLGHFLPNKKLAEVTRKLKGLEAEFHDAQQAFAQQYGKLRTSALVEWHEAARKLSTSPERVVATIQAAFPSSDRLDKYFQFSTNLFQIKLPEKLETELVTTADLEAVAEARRKAADDASAQIRTGVQSFVKDCVASLREQTAGLCDEMLASFKDGKIGVHQKTLNRLVSFIDQFKSLNFAGDRDLEARLEEVRRQFLTRTAEEYRDDKRAQARLTQGIKSLADTAREMAREDASEIVSRFGQMGVRKFTLAA